MDEDRKVIEELRETNATLKTQIIRLEKALNQAIANQDELRMNSSNETQKQKEIIEDLNKKIANYMSIVDGKNMELLNLQTALGQYYAEIEAKVNEMRQHYENIRFLCFRNRVLNLHITVFYPFFYLGTFSKRSGFGKRRMCKILRAFGCNFSLPFIIKIDLAYKLPFLLFAQPFS